MFSPEPEPVLTHLSRIDDRLDTLGGAQWFSTLDLASGYWQVEVDRQKTPFATPDPLNRFHVIPFGLCNAPETFQCLMEHVLRGLHWSTCTLLFSARQLKSS